MRWSRIVALFALTASTHAYADGEATQAAVPLDVDEAISAGLDARPEQFERDIYEFCNDENHDLKSEISGRTYCGLFDDSSVAVCPHAVNACKREPNRWWELIPDLPPWAGWILISLLVGSLLFVFARSVMDAGWARPDDIDFGDAAHAIDLEDLQALPEAPALAILRRATRAIEAAQTIEAAVLIQLAMLRYFDDTGLARFHPSRTNGDYLRAIRRQPELHALYRSVANATDRVRFGDGRIELSVVLDAIDQATTLLARPAPGAPPSDSVRAVAGVLLAMIAGAAAPACSADRVYRDASTGGMTALPPLLEKAGIETVVTRKAFADLSSEVGIVVLRTEGRRLGFAQDVRIDDLLDRGIDVIVLDDGLKPESWLPLTHTATGGVEVRTTTVTVAPTVVCGEFDGERLHQRMGSSPILAPSGTRLLWDGASEDSAVTAFQMMMVPIVVSASPKSSGRDAANGVEAYAWGAQRLDADGDRIHGGCLFFFANRDLFTNASLTRASNARFVIGFFASLLYEGETVAFLDSLNGGRGSGEGIGRSIGDAKLLPFVAHAGVWLVALLVFVGAAFGPLRDPTTREHKAFVEHVEALGRHYLSAGNAGLSHAACALSRLLVMRHRHEVRGGHEGSWQAVSRHLAERYALEESDVRAALRLGIEGRSELGLPGPDDPAPSSETMLKTLSTLLSGSVRRPNPTGGPTDGSADV